MTTSTHTLEQKRTYNQADIHPVDGFVAPGRLTTSLQMVLVDLIALHVTIKQAHWTVSGPGFRSLHQALDEVVTDAQAHADAVAERIRALRGTPDGRMANVAAATTLVEFPAGEVAVSEVITRATGLLQQVVHTLRAVHDDVDDQDATSADLLHVVIGNLEKHVWMISAEA